MTADNDELEYYRAIEDHFARERGVPHTLSSKDFQLMRRWWRDHIPLEAVLLAITEVAARRLQEGNDDPVVSLSYCRHAVRSQARRLQEMRVGGRDRTAGMDEAGTSPTEACQRLLGELRRAATMHRDLPDVAAVILETAASIERTASDLPLAELEAHLFSLETTMLERCWRTLPEGARNTIEGRAQASLEPSAPTLAVGEQMRRAVRDRVLRSFLHLPRLELV